LGDCDVIRRLTLALTACLWASLAFAQANNDSQWQTPGNAIEPGIVQLCINAAGKAVPCQTAVAGAAGFPNGATPITGNATGTTGAVVGSLAAAAGKTTYICGFNVQAVGGTATVAPITVAGLIGSSQVYQGSSSAAGGTVASAAFSPCVPASAVNTAITITTTADGTATGVDVNSWGYQL
jgi:hypothetical protein